MRLYRWLLQLSPPSLRREYGAAMEEMFARRMAEARQSSVSRRAYVCSRELNGSRSSMRFSSALDSSPETSRPRQVTTVT